MSRRAALPNVSHKHLQKLEIQNETGYDTRGIRSLMIRALKAQGMKVAGVVRVVYCGGYGMSHHGCAALGESTRCHGLNMSLSVPRNPEHFDVRQFALVMRHEVMHWRGVRHEDMSYDQRYCRGELPKWAEGIVVEHRAAEEPSELEVREKKLAHARMMLKKARSRLRRAETFVKKWERRVKAAERALVRPAPMAADPSTGLAS